MGNIAATARCPLFAGIEADKLGSLKLLSRPNGAVFKEFKYDSFGLPHSESIADIFVPLGFAGGLLDRDTGLIRFGHRDYDPTVGRFTAKDPLGDTGGDHDLYDYCVDDPVNYWDPEGLVPAGIVALAKWAGAAAAWDCIKALAPVVASTLWKMANEPVRTREAGFLSYIINELEKTTRRHFNSTGKRVVALYQRTVEIFPE